MKKHFLRLAVFALLVTSALAADTVVEEIIARVNNSVITRSDLQRAHEQLVTELREKGQGEQDLTKREKDLLRDLIDQQLLIQKAADLGITGDTDLIKRLDEIRKSMNLDSLEDLEKAAQQQGVSYEDFKQNLKNSILTQAVIGREVGSKMHITQEEMRQFYEEHKKELERPEQVRLSEILISTEKPATEKQGEEKKEGEQSQPAEPDPAVLAAAEKKAQDALAEIKKGAKFEDVARKSSQGPTAAQGGDLGYFRRGMLAKELETRTFDQMKAGEVSDVIRTKQGFIVLKVTEHTQAGIPPFKEVEGQVQEAIYMRRLQPALREYLTKLREDAFIDIKPGYVDTGASPNQTKPIIAEASTAEPGKEPAKKKKKFLIF